MRKFKQKFPTQPTSKFKSKLEEDFNNYLVKHNIKFGYEDFNKKIISQLENLKSIYFYGRNFTNQNGGTPFDTEDDEYIRNTLNNSKWEDSTFLEPLEDKDDFEQLKKLKKLVGENVEIAFETLDEKNEELMIKEGIGKNKKW